MYSLYTGFTGESVSTVISKRWGPAIPSCMTELIRSSPLWPGCRVVELTTGLGGQHPSTADALIFLMLTGLPPELRIEKR